MGSPGTKTDTTSEKTIKEEGLLKTKVEIKDDNTTETKLDPNAFVNDLYNQAVDENGNINWENLGDKAKDPAIQALVITEKRRRDTQASYTKATQKAKELETQTKISKQLEKPKLTKKQIDELEELKLQDPDEWYERKQQYERELTEEYNKQKKKLEAEFRHKEREQTLNDYNSKTKNKITVDMLKLEVPPKYLEQVDKGEMSFEELLQVANRFIYGDKTVPNDDDKLLNQPSLNSLGGYSAVGENIATLKQEYENEIF